MMGTQNEVDRILAITSLWGLVERDGQLTLGPLDGGVDAATISSGVPIPAGFVADRLQSSGALIWLSGSLDGKHGVVVVHPSRNDASTPKVRYVEIGSGNDVSVAVLSDGVLVAAVDGALFRIDTGI